MQSTLELVENSPQYGKSAVRCKGKLEAPTGPRLEAHRPVALLVQLDGTPIRMSQAWAGNKHGIDFVIGMDGALRIGNRHSHLAQLGGDATQALAAGTLRIKNGEIAHITKYSGHFNPTVAETLYFPQLFKQAGFDVSGAGMTVIVPKVTTGPAQFTGGVSRFMQVKIGGGS